MKRILSAKFNSLAFGLLTLSVTAAQPVAAPANLPLYFEASQGRAGIPAQFITRGHDYQFSIAPTEAQIVLCKTTAESAVVRMQFTGANAQAQIRGDAELPGKINYLTGNNPAQWRTALAMFAKVRVSGLYPGVDLVYYGNQQLLEYDFTVAPGADPQVIAMHFDGVDNISINPQDELILSLAGGEIRQPKPVIYQVMDGVRKEIAGGYRMADARTVVFIVGEYDRSQPLVIDPLLSYSTYFGGSAGETAYAVALDANGNTYMAGQTFSKQFSTNESFSTHGAFQTNFAGGKLTGDAFVIKLDVSGNPAYITYLGGSDDDGAFGVAVDAAGDAYVTGFTDSTNFPTRSAIQTASYHGTNISGILDKSFGYYPVDAFVAELDASGSTLVYSTYLGGSSMDCGMGIAVDATGNAYVTGYTYSSNFPTVNALQKKLACTNSFYFNANAFIAKIGPGGTNLVYSTYFGGSNYDVGKGIAVDTNGFVYVTGFTASTNFPTTNAVVQQLVWTNVVGTNPISITNSITNSVNGYLLNGSTKKTASYDAFVAKFDSTGTNLIYSTFLGGTNNDVANGIAVDNAGAAYVTGGTTSSDFPNTFGTNHSFVAANTLFNILATNGFLTKITNAIGTTNVGIAWSALFGGNGVDVGNGVALDQGGSNVFVTGSASSTNFPTYNVPGYLRQTNSGKSDAFVIAFNTTTTGSNLLYSTYLGGKDNDFGYGIAVDTSDNVYVVGQTLSTNFPTYRASQQTRNGTNDAFLTIINPTVAPPTITTQPASQTNAVGSTITFFIEGTAVPPYFLQWQKDGTNLVNGTNLLDGGSIISGATNVTLTIRNAQMNDDGSYSVILTNYGGSVTSSNAFLVLTNVLPAFTQPTNQLVGVGTTAILAVTVTNGTPPFSYQWQMDGMNLVNGHTNGATISGATSNVLTISNVQLTNIGSYRVIVTNMVGSVTSSVAVLTVQSTPVFVLQPTNQAIAVGSNAIFVTTVIGTVPLHYQWWDGTNLVKNRTVTNGPTISGATSNVLTIGNAQTTNSGNYTVIVTNIDGAVTSSVALLTVTNIPPAITRQPMSQTNGGGTTVTLAVTATGTAPLKYQWQMNGTNLVNGGHISGATSNTLTISAVQTNNNGNYTVIVTNFGGVVTSSVAVLTVQLSPVIVSQPANQAIAVGSNATFTVTVIGMGPLSYQWWVNGTNLVKNGTVNNGPTISGATTNTLTISNAQTTNSGNYTVIVTNIAGSVISSNAVLTVTNIPPTITRQSTNQTVVAGTTVTLVVTARGTAPLRYQWQVNGTNLVNGVGHISGATNAMLTITTAQTNNSGSYTVIVTNYGGSVTSSVPILLTVAASPVILTQPADQTVAAGSNANFTVTAIGIMPLSYQWQVNGTNLVNGGGISGATATNLNISNVPTNYSGNSYSVIVTNRSGSATSSSALLTVASSPVIIVQPTNQAMPVGATATLAVTAAGAAPLSYQWQLNETNLVDGGSISGSTNNVLTISDAQTTNSGNYTVIITNLFGSVTSSNALLTVTNITPEILLQPTNSQTVWVGSTVTNLSFGSGAPPYSFQWLKDGTNLVDGTNISGSIISGATNFVLIISNAQTNDSGIYWLIIMTGGGSITTSNSILTVLPLPLFGSIIAGNGGGFILSGTGGESNGTYYVLTSSNLLAPLTNWTHIATDHFDGAGGFIFTNTVQTNAPQLFHILQMP